MKNLCIDCGYEYEYDTSKPLGSSSVRCCKCRRKDSLKNKKKELLNIAGKGSIQCRKCGYGNSVHALNLMDGINTLEKLSSQEKAATQFILCNNCKTEVEANEVEFKVVSKNYPIEVDFFTREVVVVRKQIKPIVEYHHEFQDVEITTGGSEARSVSKKAKRLN